MNQAGDRDRHRSKHSKKQENETFGQNSDSKNRKKSKDNSTSSDEKLPKKILDGSSSSTSVHIPQKDPYILTYVQNMNTSTNQYDTYQYLINRKTKQSEQVTKIHGLVSLSTIGEKTVFAAIMRIEENAATVIGSCIIPSDYHLKITKSTSQNLVVIDELVNISTTGKTEHLTRNASLTVPAAQSLPPSVVVIRLIRKNLKTGQYVCYETLLPDFCPESIKVSSENGKYIMNSVEFYQSKSAGIRNPLYPHISFSQNGIFACNGEIKTQIVDYPNGAQKQSCFLVTKFTAEAHLKVLNMIPYFGSETFVIDGLNDKGQPRTMDMFNIKDSKVIRTKSVNSSFSVSKKEHSYRPGMILLLVNEPNADGVVQLLDTLFFGFKAKEINLRFTMIDPEKGSMILLKTTPIPQSKLIILKKESRERLKKLSDINTVPINLTMPPKRPKKHHHNHHHHNGEEHRQKKTSSDSKKSEQDKKEKPKKEENKPRKESKPESQPKIIQEYYYYSDEEETEVEVRNITLYVDEDGNVVSDEKGGKTGQNIDEVLKEMNQEDGQVKVVEKEE